MRRAAAFAFLAGFVLATSMATDAHAQSQPSAERFSNAAVTGGVTITRKACAALEAQETAAWVEVDGRGECLRYYAAQALRVMVTPPVTAALEK
ncbi:alpha/beta hydrolase, partial [Azospirillum brasilense]|nr:alpha/beta hydrolase [Azospirillum brasilense]